VRGLDKPRVFVAEWDDPPYGSGHWLPEMVDAAGGTNVLSSPGEYSFPTTWDTVLAESPDVVVLAACGFTFEQALERAGGLSLPVRTVSSTATRTSRGPHRASRTASASSRTCSIPAPCPIPGCRSPSC
jgi:ABC-type Fe3+-hydroxamate transport system, periplasmic component